MIRRLLTFVFRFFVLLVVIFVGSGICILTDGLFDTNDEADVALVFGSGMRADGTPGPALKERLDGAVKFYEDGKYHLIIVSGTTHGDGFNEAKGMAQYLVTQKVPVAAIVPDATGGTHEATARAVVKIMNERNLRSVMIVSYYSTITRMKMALRHEGVLTVRQMHVGVPKQDDIIPLAREVVATYHDFARDVLVPGLDRLQKKAQEEAPIVKEAIQKDVQKVQKDVKPESLPQKH